MTSFGIFVLSCLLMAAAFQHDERREYNTAFLLGMLAWIFASASWGIEFLNAVMNFK